MPYLLIIFMGLVCIVLIDYIARKESDEVLSKSKQSDITHTIISEGGKHALIMYNHDPHDEAQLSWALNNARGIENIDGQNLYFYNIGSKQLCKRSINSIFVKLKQEEYTILNGYPNNHEVSYLFIIKNNKENIVFNAFINQ